MDTSTANGHFDRIWALHDIRRLIVNIIQTQRHYESANTKCEHPKQTGKGDFFHRSKGI